MALELLPLLHENSLLHLAPLRRRQIQEIKTKINRTKWPKYRCNGTNAHSGIVHGIDGVDCDLVVFFFIFAFLSFLWFFISVDCCVASRCWKSIFILDDSCKAGATRHLALAERCYLRVFTKAVTAIDRHTWCAFSECCCALILLNFSKTHQQYFSRTTTLRRYFICWYIRLLLSCWKFWFIFLFFFNMDTASGRFQIRKIFEKFYMYEYFKCVRRHVLGSLFITDW